MITQKTNTIMIINNNFKKEVRPLRGASKYVCDADGNIYNRLTGKKKVACPNGWAGYMMVRLVMDDGRSVCKTVHRLVWQAWNGDIPKGMEIDHCDDDKKNNALGNLQLLSHAANCRKSSKKTGEAIRGAKRGTYVGLRKAAKMKSKRVMAEQAKEKIRLEIRKYLAARRKG